MKNQKSVLSPLLITAATLAGASAAQANVANEIGNALVMTLSSPSLSTLFTMCKTGGLGHICRSADEATIEEAMEFRATGKMTVEFSEKLQTIRTNLQQQNLDASMNDDELSQLLIDGKVGIQTQAE